MKYVWIGFSFVSIRFIQGQLHQLNLCTISCFGLFRIPTYYFAFPNLFGISLGMPTFWKSVYQFYCKLCILYTSQAVQNWCYTRQNYHLSSSSVTSGQGLFLIKLVNAFEYYWKQLWGMVSRNVSQIHINLLSQFSRLLQVPDSTY